MQIYSTKGHEFVKTCREFLTNGCYYKDNKHINNQTKHRTCNNQLVYSQQNRFRIHTKVIIIDSCHGHVLGGRNYRTNVFVDIGIPYYT